MLFKFASVLALASYAAAECPNACSGHGQCSNFDMCTCNRNFEGNDCSLRTCPFDRAHVDTAKGDLDGSLSVTWNTVITNSQVYPYGTTEKFPKMTKMVGSAETVLTDTAHEYMECSNKGICDRKKGECECFEGYEGASCQRASCPNACSGHGTCETISELAFDNHENIYALWDKDATMGCSCDAGFSGSDCSARECKYGIDPLYSDDTTARVQETNIRIESTFDTTLYGTYALKFYDVFGEDFVTTPLVAATTYTAQVCTDVMAALKALPNDAIESVDCSGSTVSTAKGFDLKLKFKTNPGVLKQMEILDHLDGTQPTLMAIDGAALQTAPDLSITTKGYYKTSVYQEGITGSFVDYFASKCIGVQGKATADTSTPGASGVTWVASAIPGSIGYYAMTDTAEEALLKACLGDSDGDTTNNVEVYNWDMGYLIEMDGYHVFEYTIGSYPHAVMTVPLATDQNPNTNVDSDYYGKATDAGDFHLMWYDPSATALQRFRLANLGTNTQSNEKESSIHTTDGVVQQLGRDKVTANYANSGTDNELTSMANETRIVGMFSQYSNKIYTNIDASCESGSTLLQNCLNKGDRLFIVDGCWGDGEAITLHRRNDPTVPEGNPDGGVSFFGDNVKFGCADLSGADTGTGNLYTIEKIYTQPFSANTTFYDQHWGAAAQFNGFEDRFVITVDQNIGWDGSSLGDPDNSGGRHSGVVILFKFTPASTGTYTYVSQCSNRGVCNSEEGLCECFKGYHGDACQKQSSLAT